MVSPEGASRYILLYYPPQPTLTNHPTRTKALGNTSHRNEDTRYVGWTLGDKPAHRLCQHLLKVLYRSSGWCGILGTLARTSLPERMTM